MAFRLKLDEPIEKGFRRIAAEQVQRARAQIVAQRDPTTEIHEARKCMKRIRALLRLVREGLGDPVYRTENARFRSIAAAMAPARDASVARQTLAKLKAATPSAGEALGRFERALERHLNGTATTADTNLSELPALLDRATRQLRKLALDPDSFATLERGLVRNYKKGRKFLDIAFTEQSDEAFHDWRKCVQTHWRHMALLSRAQPPLFEAHIETARDLSQMLGDDHDLAMLKGHLDVFDAEQLPASDRRTIAAAIDSEQRALRQTARLRGQMIFAERPKAHGQRIAGIWNSAVALHRLERPTGKAGLGKRDGSSAPVPART